MLFKKIEVLSYCSTPALTSALLEADIVVRCHASVSTVLSIAGEMSGNIKTVWKIRGNRETVWKIRGNGEFPCGAIVSPDFPAQGMN